jgi:hypothetical protein
VCVARPRVHHEGGLGSSREARRRGRAHRCGVATDGPIADYGCAGVNSVRGMVAPSLPDKYRRSSCRRSSSDRLARRVRRLDTASSRGAVSRGTPQRPDGTRARRPVRVRHLSHQRRGRLRPRSSCSAPFRQRHVVCRSGSFNASQQAICSRPSREPCEPGPSQGAGSDFSQATPSRHEAPRPGLPKQQRLGMSLRVHVRGPQRPQPPCATPLSRVARQAD